MSEEQNNYELSPEEVKDNERLVALAKKIAIEAVISSNIPELTSDSKYENPQWDIFYTEEEKDIILTIQFNPPITVGILHTSLVNITWRILREVEILLSNTRAMSLLGVEEADRELTIYDKTLTLTKDYIARLPYVIYHSFHQVVNDALVSHIKKIVEYGLREHWLTLGLPKDYSLIPENRLSNLAKLFPEIKLNLIPYLETTDKEFSAYRKATFSDRKALRTTEVLKGLPDDYKQLQSQYKKAIQEYNSQKTAFFKVNRRASFEDWGKYWEEYSGENFPDLYLSGEIQDLTPSQLAYRHLAELLGSSVDYMQKLIISARKQAKNALNQQKKDI